MTTEKEFHKTTKKQSSGIVFLQNKDLKQHNLNWKSSPESEQLNKNRKVSDSKNVSDLVFMQFDCLSFDLQHQIH